MERLRIARLVATEAAAVVATSPPRDVERKVDPADLVTDVDLAVEDLIRGRLFAAFPGDTFVGEERADRPGTSGFTWFIDPVDGTTNFASGLPWSSVSVGCADGAGPLVGVVADPWRNEVFSASRGTGAWCDGAPVPRNRCTSLAGTVVLTEWLGHRPWPDMARVLTALAREYATTRILGSSALSLAETAAGRAAACLIGSYSPVDVLAAEVIAREAGLVVAGFDGGPVVDGAPFFAAQPGIARQLQRIIG